MGMMNASDLKDKLDQAQEKVEKRLLTIQKLCKKLNVNYDDLIKAYSEVEDFKTKDYLPSKVAREIVNQFVQPKEKGYDENGISTMTSDDYDFNSKVSQLEDNLPKLYDLRRVVNNWQVKYDTELNKENAPKIQVLVDFLNEWGELATNWYHNSANTLVDAKNEFHQILAKFLSDKNYKSLNYDQKQELAKEFNEFMYNEYGVRPQYRFSTVDDDDWVNAKTNVDTLTKDLAVVRFEKQDEDDYYSYVNDFGYGLAKGKYVLESFNDEKLSKIIEAEKKAKYEDLCNRISAVVGEITDVSNLRISAKGNLDGIVTGTKGKAKVETVGAGGYNIQIFHYRVLVHKIKE